VINGMAATAADVGAVHSGEIVYAFGTFGCAPKVPWQPVDWRLSDTMMTYWTNFAKTGDPNGPGVPPWPRYRAEDGHQVMHLGADVLASPEAHRDRYEFWDAHSSGTKP
jgi:para-nitrobenzyl esterase